MNSVTFFLWNIQILLESLPISSSAHLRLICAYFYPRREAAPSKIVVPDSTTQELMHIPTIIVIFVTIAYFLRASTMILSVPTLLNWLFAIVIADAITGIVYIALKRYPAVRDRFPLLAGLAISAIALLSLMFCNFGTIAQITPLHALIIGLAQAFTLLPGISRLALTIVTATWLGIDPLTGAFFSLAIELPLIIAAVMHALIRSPHAVRSLFNLTFNQSAIILLSTALSCLLLIGVIMMHTSHMLSLFGWYLFALILYLYFRRNYISY